MIHCARPPLLAACLLLSAAGATKAAEGTDVPAPTTPTDEVITSARETVRSTALWLASGVDSWFGDRPFTEGGGVTDGRLSLSVYQRERESTEVRLRFNARFRLPNLERKTYLFIGRDNPREVLTDQPGTFARQQQLQRESASDRSFFAGLGRVVNDRVDYRIGFRGGLKPYLQARYRKPWELGPYDRLEFRQTFFWSVADHLGSTTALSYEHSWTPTLVSRWVNAATVTRVDTKFNWYSSVGTFKALGHDRQFSVELLASGRQSSGVPVLDYGVQARWEQPIYKDWLAGELVFGHFWPRKDAASPRLTSWAVGTGLKMRF
jgi:hypothetical protein